MRTSALLKSVAKDAVLYGIGSSLSGLVALLLAPILTRAFSTEEYGALALLQTTAALLVTLAAFNLSTGAFYYYYRTEDDAERRRILSTGLWFHVGAAVAVGLLAFAAAPLLGWLLARPPTGPGAQEILGADAYASYFRIAAVLVAVRLLAGYFLSLLRMVRQPVRFVTLSVGSLLVQLGLVAALLIWWDFGIPGVLWAGVGAAGISIVAGALLTFRRFSLTFDTDAFRRMLGFCLPQFPSVLLAFALMQSNRYFLNEFAPLSAQGIYNIAYQLAAAFVLLVGAFRMAWDPQAMAIMNHPAREVLYARVYSAYMVLMSVCGGVLALAARFALLILTPPEYHQAFDLTIIVVYGLLLQGANNILGIGISLGERTKFISYAQVFAVVVNLGLNLLLIPVWHARGAAAALAGGLVAQNIAYYVFAQRLHPMPYAYVRTHVMALAVFSVNIAFVPLLSDASVLQSGLLVLAGAPIMVGIAALLGLDRELRRGAWRAFRGWRIARKVVV